MNTAIMQGRTEMAEMLPGNRMQVIQDVSPDAVPRSSNPVKGAQRVAQLGQDAMEKILAAATLDICMPDRGFVIFYEMNMLVGDMFDAFLETRNRLNCPTFFATACGSESHARWWEYNKRKLLKAKHLAGEQHVAGFPVLPKEVPKDLLEQSPRPPQLRKMVIQPGGRLCVPDKLIMKWRNDPTYGPRSRAFLDEFSEEPSCASLSGISRAIVLVI